MCRLAASISAPDNARPFSSPHSARLSTLPPPPPRSFEKLWLRPIRKAIMSASRERRKSNRHQIADGPRLTIELYEDGVLQSEIDAKLVDYSDWGLRVNAGEPVSVGCSGLDRRREVPSEGLGGGRNAPLTSSTAGAIVQTVSGWDSFSRSFPRKGLGQANMRRKRGGRGSICTKCFKSVRRLIWK